MKIEVSGTNINISGNIKSVSDFQNIKENLDKIIDSNKNITINITDSLSITSSVIGYLNKLVLHDGIHINMNISNEQLLVLLNDLNLSSTFNVRKA